MSFFIFLSYYLSFLGVGGVGVVFGRIVNRNDQFLFDLTYIKISSCYRYFEINEFCWICRFKLIILKDYSYVLENKYFHIFIKALFLSIFTLKNEGNYSLT